MPQVSIDGVSLPRVLRVRVRVTHALRATPTPTLAGVTGGPDIPPLSRTGHEERRRGLGPLASRLLDEALNVHTWEAARSGDWGGLARSALPAVNSPAALISNLTASPRTTLPSLLPSLLASSLLPASHDSHRSPTAKPVSASSSQSVASDHLPEPALAPVVEVRLIVPLDDSLTLAEWALAPFGPSRYKSVTVQTQARDGEAQHTWTLHRAYVHIYREREFPASSPSHLTAVRTFLNDRRDSTPSSGSTLLHPAPNNSVPSLDGTDGFDAGLPTENHVEVIIRAILSGPVDYDGRNLATVQSGSGNGNNNASAFKPESLLAAASSRSNAIQAIRDAVGGASPDDAQASDAGGALWGQGASGTWGEGSDTEHAQRMAQYAGDVYRPDDKEAESGALPFGAERVKTFHDPDSGFDAALYREQDGKLVLAYRGTEDGKDWRANLGQGTGIDSTQYREAVNLARDIKQQYPDANVEITGHSLGGGLATVASAATGYPVTTFNAANVNPSTYAYNNIDPANIPRSSTNYQVGGEPLSTFQNIAPAIGAVGGALLGHTVGAGGIGAVLGAQFGENISNSPLNQVVLEPRHPDGTPMGTFENKMGHGMKAVSDALQYKRNQETASGGASGSW